MTTDAPARFLILVPVFNDWHALELLLPQIDRNLAARHARADVIVVDDASTITPAFAGNLRQLSAIGSVGLLRLRRNLGHQRAIAVGLAYVFEHCAAPLVVIMDADGEDRPEDIMRLVDRCRSEGLAPIVFAERTKRSESLLFRLFYRLYRLLHLVLTGHGVRVGNFSAVPWQALSSIVVVSDLWNHYAAAVVKARLPHLSIVTTRGTRLAGAPAMNFNSLVVHGLSALAVFGDVVGVRLLAAFCSLGVAMAVAGTIAAAASIVTGRPLSWQAVAIGASMLLALAILGLVSLLATLGLLANRGAATFIALRDYHHFVSEFRTIAGD